MHFMPQYAHYTWLKQTNLAVSDIVNAGKRRKIAAMEAAYRDRAAERRKAFNQPEKPSWHALQGADKKRRFEGPTAAPEPVAIAPPGQDGTNVGNQLLSKLGWKAGTGLGVGGEGRVEPIKVHQFAERAGLGSGIGVQVGDGKSQTVKNIVSPMQPVCRSWKGPSALSCIIKARCHQESLQLVTPYAIECHPGARSIETRARETPWRNQGDVYPAAQIKAKYQSAELCG